MNRRSILAAYKKKSSHLQTGVTGFKSGNLFKTKPKPPNSLLKKQPQTTTPITTPVVTTIVETTAVETGAVI